MHKSHSQNHIFIPTLLILLSRLKMLKHVLFALLVFYAYSKTTVHTQIDRSGFISIDCGAPVGSKYTDATTGIVYMSDESYTDSGISGKTELEHRKNYPEQQFVTVRAFPNGTRNCYTIRPTEGKGYKHLIRASFLYGDYDGNDQAPKFDLHLGVDYWDTVVIPDESTLVRKEIIHTLSSDYLHVCLVRTGVEIPFISVLELRLISDAIYETEYGSLKLFTRVDFGSMSNQSMRYKDDAYDRIWWSYNGINTTPLSTTDTSKQNIYKLPSAVMRTASSPQNPSRSLYYSWEPYNLTDQFYVYLHFTEVQNLEANKSRWFNIYCNGLYFSGPYSPSYLSDYTVYSDSPILVRPKYELLINQTLDSSFPPVVNALEVYQVQEFIHSQTEEKDGIKSFYGLMRNWQGDPCSPQEFAWDGLQCNYDGFQPPRVISLNLSSAQLNGKNISSEISNLAAIQILDLSNNNLTGPIPDFLAQLDFLRVLNLTGNNLTGQIPQELLEKARSGSLSFSSDPRNNIGKASCSGDCRLGQSKNKKVVVPVLAAVLTVTFVILIILTSLRMLKRRKQVTRNRDADSNVNVGTVETKNQQFTYSEVLRFTSNFERVIGKGGSGTVYHGSIGDTQIAVKMLTPSSVHAYNEFMTEANLLLTIHHKNLTSLVGYCNEGTNMGIIYEYMPNGNLQQHLSDNSSCFLSWAERLQIAIGAAQGLEYLHHGCKPPIIHRDVKSTNILLTADLQAKLSDFGLSRAFPIEDGSHVSTNTIVGTPGYLDPEYYLTKRLTEKSDVYSFGIVLLEIIAGRRANGRNYEETHIIQWTTSLVEKGDIKSIVDKRLQEDYVVSSVWRAMELAMTCLSLSSIGRPAMTDVVIELKECLKIEVANHEPELRSTTRTRQVSTQSMFGPRPR